MSTLIVDVPDVIRVNLISTWLLFADLKKSRGWDMSTLIVDVPDEMPRKLELYLTSSCRPDKEPRLGHVYPNCGRP